MALPTRYEEFDDRPDDAPWLDRPGAEDEIARRVAAGELSEDRAERLRHWRENGWVILDVRVDDEPLDRHKEEMQQVVERNAGRPIHEWSIQFQNMFEHSSTCARLMRDPGILEWVDLILGRRSRPYQSLSMPQGSQIPPHADRILMTTHPANFMCAAWIALEDIEPDSGPLTLWSGSHKLPYLSAASVGLPPGATEAERSAAYNQDYYPRMRERVEQGGFEPYYFVPKKGEVLLWHSNIVHAGSPVQRAGSTRNSLIVHYFAEDVHHYSDLFDRGCDLPDV